MKSLSLLMILTLVFSGCSRRHTVVPPQATVTPIAPVLTPKAVPRPPYKKHKMKTVQNTNYTDAYMYPEDTSLAKKDPVIKAPIATQTATTVTNTVSKEECISMIGEDKFNRYTQMLGSEASSIKRCAMLKAMK
ncbi:MAG: hypothetical protein Q9M36_04025 [Sulfurovum sp.]|nr:hypothetical protein [Sulfurovum sp.]